MGETGSAAGGGRASAAAGPPPPSRRELLAAWGTAAGLLLAAKLLARIEPSGLLDANLAGVGALLFLGIPDRKLVARGERWESYGLPWWGVADRRTWRAWGRGAAAAALAALLLFPLFSVGFWAFGAWLPHLPGPLRALLAPYRLPPSFHPRLPAGFALQALLQLVVVALPEELFYRGFLQTAWKRAGRAAGGRSLRLLGAELGPGFFATQALFALGHLASLEPWRLGTFFPGLLFGWMRERTGSVAAAVVLHALSNLFLFTLEASFYGRWR